MADFDLRELGPGTHRGTNDNDAYFAGEEREGFYRVDGRRGTDTLTFALIEDGRVFVDLQRDFGVILSVSNGARYRIENIEIVNGSFRNDHLSGDNRDNTFFGFGGNDTIRGRDGEDTLDGGAGRDKLYGGDDDDDLRGGRGDDRLKGDSGDDTLDGGRGNDKLTGGSGDDTFRFRESDNDGSDYEVITDFEVGGGRSDRDEIVFLGFSNRFRDGLEQELNGGNNKYVEVYENRSGDTFIYYDSNGSSRGGDKFRIELEDVDADDLDFGDHFTFI